MSQRRGKGLRFGIILQTRRTFEAALMARGLEKVSEGLAF